MGFMCNIKFVCAVNDSPRPVGCGRYDICDLTAVCLEDSGLVGYGRTALAQWFSTFRMIVMPSSSGTGRFTVAGESPDFPRKISSTSPKYTVSHGSRPECQDVEVVTQCI